MTTEIIVNPVTEEIQVIEESLEVAITPLEIVHVTHYDGYQLPQTQVDFNQNTTENVVIGDITTDREVSVYYTLVDIGGTITEWGEIKISFVGGTAGISAERTGEPSPFEVIDFSADIDNNDLRLNITAGTVGSNFKFRYTKAVISNNT